MKKADRFGRTASFEAQQRNLAKAQGKKYGPPVPFIASDGWEYASIADRILGTPIPLYYSVHNRERQEREDTAMWLASGAEQIGRNKWAFPPGAVIPMTRIVSDRDMCITLYPRYIR